MTTRRTDFSRSRSAPLGEPDAMRTTNHLIAMKRALLVVFVLSAGLTANRAAQPRSLSAQNQESLIALLQSAASPEEKAAACARLQRIGTDQAIPALAALLADPRLSHAARHALETMSSPAAGRALVEALATTSGAERLGIVGSLGVRREAQAVASLARLLAAASSAGINPMAPEDTNGVALAVAAAEALGAIDSPGAVAALEQTWRASGATIHHAAADALLRQANHRLDTGDQAGARRLFGELRDRETIEPLWLAALQGLIRSSGDDGLRLFVEALATPSRAVQKAALGLVPDLPAEGASTAFARLLPTLSPTLQVALLDGWLQRPEPPPLASVTPLLGSPSLDVRLSAIRALGRVGDGPVVAPLLEMAAVRGPEQDAARLALTEMQAGDVPARLLAILGESRPEILFEAARILADRGERRAAAPLLRRAADESPRIRQAALRALVLLLDESQLDELVRLVVDARDDTARAEVARAVALAHERIVPKQATSALQPLLEQLVRGTPAVRVALLPASRTLALPEVRDALRAGIAEQHADIRAAAIRAASRSIDVELLPDLVAIACRAPEDEFRDLATRACVRLLLAGGERIPLVTRLDAFRGISGGAMSPNQKRTLLTGLSAGRTLAELELARSLVEDDAVRDEAMNAVLDVAPRVGESASALAIVKGLRNTTADPESQLKLDAVLGQITARAGFVTSWRSAEFSRAVDRNAASLLDFEFAPEKQWADFRSSAARRRLANWQPMAAGTNANRPMIMRGGGAAEYHATYAYTWLQASRAGSATLALEHDAPVKVWLNGQPVRFPPADDRQRRGQTDHAGVKLEPGANLLVIKIAATGRAWAFAMRLTNANGSALTDVSVDASAEPGS